LSHNSRNNIFDEVLQRVKPSSADVGSLHDTARDIIGRLDNEARQMGLDVYSIHVGSTARDTWLKGTKDIDIFLMFPTDTPREKLEISGLMLARTLSDQYEERYAEHPYINTKYQGLDVDLVPCYRVDDPSSIISAVDRSPFHNDYVISHINGLCDEARLLKQFARGTGVYGSELRTQGFSGYLCELLIIHYGSFLNVIINGANFRRGQVIDIEGHIDPSVEHPEPLIVIDPVDPKRNVAAALSSQKFYEFIGACRRFLESPSIDYFFPPPVKPFSEEELLELLSQRETLLFTIAFDAPDIVEDTLFPQLRKAEESISAMMERHEFKVYRSGVWSDMIRCVILFEMLVWELPDIERHLGPPLEEREHSKKFLEKYPEAYIMDYRYAADIKRRHRDVYGLISHKLNSCGLGKQVARSLREESIILTDRDVLAFGPELGKYLKIFLAP
jgi:tRNA nucleotidyltransferase (CCA-adding enzyme)